MFPGCICCYRLIVESKVLKFLFYSDEGLIRWGKMKKKHHVPMLVFKIFSKIVVWHAIYFVIYILSYIKNMHDCSVANLNLYATPCSCSNLNSSIFPQKSFYGINHNSCQIFVSWHDLEINLTISDILLVTT